MRLHETTDRWRDVLRREPCVYCGRSPADLATDARAPRMTIEHIVPRSRARDVRDNLAPACATCNVTRGDTPLLWFLVHAHATRVARTPPARTRSATKANRRRVRRLLLEERRAPALRVALVDLAH